MTFIIITIIVVLSLVLSVYLLHDAKEIKLDNDKIYKDELKKS